MKNKFKLGYLLLTLSCMACSNFFEVEPNNVLNEDKNYQKYYEVYSSFVGSVIRFQEASEHYVIISELTGGLITPTSNATTEFWDVFRFQAGNGNSLIAPDPYYKLIINCNDFLRHVFIYKEENPGAIAENTLNGMISETIRYRAWAYMTLGKLYGQAFYHDYSLTDYMDLNRGKLLKFDELLNEVLYSIENGFNGIDGTNTLVWRDITNITGNDWQHFTIPTDILLGELYLWKGDYEKALDFLMNIIKNGEGKFVIDNSLNYGYIFANPLSSSLAELISVVPFDANRKQQNNLQYYFSNTPPNVYYLKPAERLTTLYDIQEWETTAAEGYGDRIRKAANIGVENGDTIVRKYHIGKTPYQRDHYISIYRAGELHLMIAEALNNMNLQEEAMAFLNDGVIQYISPGGYLQRPFNSPRYSSYLTKNIGVRGRVDLKRHILPDTVTINGTQVNINTLPEEEQFLIKAQIIDSLILNEYALELAFEGKRWGALIRMGKRWGADFVAHLISEKFPPEERSSYLEFLRSEENWFINYDPLKN